MFQFIYWLKALAAVFITNSHYSNVWPISSLAFGGHLGNTLFFIVSGFCMYNIKDAFPKWYLKRVLRIYPAVWITNIIYVVVGYFRIDSFSSFIYYFFYPTGFHFVGSIMILYIFLYFVRFIQRKLKIGTFWFMLAVFLAFIVPYVLMFDKSTYHIDSVGEKWVLFMFAESILMGTLLREKLERISKAIKTINWLSVVLLLGGYFIGKKTFSNISAAMPMQCFQPMIVIALSFSITVLFIKMEKRGVFSKCNKALDKLVMWAAAMTLEIYLGQDIIISHFANVSFPLSFLVVTTSIVIFALTVHTCSTFFQNKCSRLLRLK